MEKTQFKIRIYPSKHEELRIVAAEQRCSISCLVVDILESTALNEKLKKIAEKHEHSLADQIKIAIDVFVADYEKVDPNKGESYGS
jgi:hypothetical protein